LSKIKKQGSSSGITVVNKVEIITDFSQLPFDYWEDLLAITSKLIKVGY